MLKRNQNKVKFVSRRGNIESENLKLWQEEALEVAAELQNISCYDLQRHFDRVTNKIQRKDQDIFIYVLIDPLDFEVKYVGKSNNPEYIYRAHVSDFRPNKHAGNGPKCQWIKGLLEKGHRPILDVLCKCSEPESENYEYRYFKLFNYGNNLLNSATIQKETFQYTIKL